MLKTPVTTFVELHSCINARLEITRIIVSLIKCKVCSYSRIVYATTLLLARNARLCKMYKNDVSKSCYIDCLSLAIKYMII